MVWVCELFIETVKINTLENHGIFIDRKFININDGMDVTMYLYFRTIK